MGAQDWSDFVLAGHTFYCTVSTCACAYFLEFCSGKVAENSKSVNRTRMEADDIRNIEEINNAIQGLLLQKIDMKQHLKRISSNKCSSSFFFFFFQFLKRWVFPLNSRWIYHRYYVVCRYRKFRRNLKLGAMDVKGFLMKDALDCKSGGLVSKAQWHERF